MKRFFGFTLSELMIALLVLGVLCATVIPAVTNNMPNQNKILIKRAFYNTSNIVKDMINNTTLYSPEGGKYIGFDNFDTATYKGKTYSGSQKFIDIFIDLLNSKGEVDESESFCDFEKTEICMDLTPPAEGEECTNKQTLDGSVGCKTINSTDGMRWTFSQPIIAINDIENQHIARILVDVNGDLKPNCYQGSTTTECKDRKKNFDQFRMLVFTDGTVIINSNDIWARNILRPSSEINSDD